MSFYLDIKLPIGFRVQAGIRKSFYGTMKSLLVEVLRDLEEGGNKHTSYFLKERISPQEKKVMITLLRSIEEEHDYHFKLSTESFKETEEFSTYIKKSMRRYNESNNT